MNLSDMRRVCAAEIGLDNSATSTPWTAEQTLLDGWANEAVMDFLQKSRIVTNIRTATIGAIANYQLPATSMAVKDIQVTTSNVDRPLTRVTSDELIHARAVPGSGITRMWASEGDYVLLYPAATTSEVFTFYEVLKPTRLASLTDDPSNTSFGLIPEQFHHILMQFMFWKSGSYADHQASNRGLNYRAVYLEELQTVSRFRAEVPPVPVKQ